MIKGIKILEYFIDFAIIQLVKKSKGLKQMCSNTKVQTRCSNKIFLAIGEVLIEIFAYQI